MMFVKYSQNSIVNEVLENRRMLWAHTQTHREKNIEKHNETNCIHPLHETKNHEKKEIFVKRN